MSAMEKCRENVVKMACKMLKNRWGSVPCAIPVRIELFETCYIADNEEGYGLCRENVGKMICKCLIYSDVIFPLRTTINVANQYFTIFVHEKVHEK